jgi:hypothetical protein
MAAVAAAGAVMAGGCSPSASNTPGPIGTSSLSVPVSGTPGATLASPIVGVVTGIESTGLTEVRGFSLRTDDGETIEFRIGMLENGAQFPPGHLAEHLATSSPVRVSFTAEGPDLVAYRIEDVSGS